jgi:hypothetical protein
MGAKVGTGELRPFKKDSCGCTTISNSTDGARREGFFDKQEITRASRNVTELTPFKTGPEGPGRNTNPDHPPFMERKDNGIRTFPAFSKREA